MIREHRRRSARGFTLVELIVSLAAGLIISVAVVGLARTATTTFHEEVRASSTELSLRIATERLRFDLSRVGFMSTSNIQRDPRLSVSRGTTGPATAVGLPVLSTLAGIAYIADGSNSDSRVATLSNVVGNNVNPDAILLGGNFTTADEYIVQSVNLSAGGAGCAGGQAVTLSRESAAVLRVLLKPDGTANANASSELNTAFQPVPGQFMARVTDDTGFTQYVALCPGAVAADVVGGIPAVYISAATPILTAAQTGGAGGTTGFGVGRMTINPVQLVRWDIQRRIDTQLDRVDQNGNIDNTKFDLFRTWVDATGVALDVGRQLIAEYAVDLEFSFIVNGGTTAVPTQQLFDFGASNNAATAQALTPSPGVTPPSVRPEMIRGIRFRLAVRTAQADRTQNIATPTTGYLYRYCTDPAGCGTSQLFARVRTIVSEVNLPNQ
jgi:prepilin-type N-terminal cleavage/methylation domain-containing protein